MQVIKYIVTTIIIGLIFIILVASINKCTKAIEKCPKNNIVKRFE